MNLNKFKNKKYSLKIPLLIVLSIILVSIIVFNIGISKKYAIGYIEQKISKSINQKLTVGGFNTNLINRLEIQDISLEIKNNNFIQISNLEVNYFLPILLSDFLIKKTVTINSIKIEETEISLFKYEDSTWNFDKLSEGKKEKSLESSGGRIDIDIKNIVLNNSTIKVTDIATEKSETISIPKLKVALQTSDNLKGVKFSLDSKNVESTYQNLAIEKIATKANYSNTGNSFIDLLIEVNEGNLKLDANLKRKDLSEFEINLNTKNLGFGSIQKLNSIFSMKGDINSENIIDGRGTFKLNDSQINNIKLDNISNEIVILNNKININNGTIQSSAGVGDYNGYADLSYLLNKNGYNEAEFNINLRQVKYAEIMKYFLNYDDQESIDFIDEGTEFDSKLNVTGKWKDPADLDVNLIIGNLNIKDNFGNLSSMGTANYSNQLLSFELESILNKFNLATVLLDQKYSSAINSEFRIQGSIPFGEDREKSLEASLKGKLNKSNIFGNGISSGNFDIDFKNNNLDVNSANLVSENFNLYTSGTLSNADNTRLDFKLEVKQLSMFSSLLDKVIDGAMVSKGYVKGNIQNPEFKFEGNISDFKFDEVLNVDSTRFQTSGVFNLESPNFTLLADAEGFKYNSFAFTSLNILTSGKGEKLDFNLKGDDGAGGESKIVFSVDGFQKSVKVINVSKLKIDNVDLNFANRKNMIFTIKTGNFTVNNFNIYGRSGGYILADADIDYDGKVYTKISISNLDVHELATIVDEENLVGTINGNIDVLGTTERPEINSSIDISGLNFRKLALEAINAELNYKNKNLSFNINMVEQSQNLFSGSGDIKYSLNLKKPFENISSSKFLISLKSDNLDLSRFTGLIPQVDEISGLLNSNLNISGSYEEPDLDGTLKIKNGLIKVSELKNTLSFDLVNINFKDNMAYLSPMDLKTGEGNAEFEGQINLQSTEYTMTAKLKSFSIEPDNLNTYVDGDLKINGSREYLDISGAIKNIRTVVQIPDSEVKKAPDIKYVDQRESDIIEIKDESPDDFFKSMVTLDLLVEIPNKLWVKGKGANIEFKGGLDIKKQRELDPAITGSLNVVRGSYKTFGKIFKVEEGKITFPGTTDYNPYLDIKALYRVSDVNIYVGIGGRAQNPEIKLSSEPFLTETNIISYLVFGKSSDKIGSGEKTQVDGLASSVAGGIASSELEKLLGDKFSLDELSIKGGFGNTEVEAGKYITDKLYLSYQYGPSTTSPLSTTNESSSNVKAEYEINDSFSLESIIGSENQGVDVFYNYNF